MSAITPEEKRLAQAVILQWMEDYANILRKPKKLWNKEDEITFKWLETEWAQFWCYVAEIDIKKLKTWAEKTKQNILHRRIHYLALNIPRKNLKEVANNVR